jgi:AcrR family transcriptional regulator
MTYREIDDLPPRYGPQGPPRRRARRKAAESREQILRAATREFVTHGFAGARVSRIVSNAGSNPRMLYHYFGSKSHLYVAVLEEALGGLRRKELQIDIEHLGPRDCNSSISWPITSSTTSTWCGCCRRRTCSRPNTCVSRRAFRKCLHRYSP